MSANNRRRRNRVQGGWADDRPESRGQDGGRNRGNQHGGGQWKFESGDGGGGQRRHRGPGQRSDQVPKFGEVASRPAPAERTDLRRVRVIRSGDLGKHGASGILYWMNRDQRTDDNWALLYAQELAVQHQMPLHVCFCVVDNYLGMNIRHYTFMMQGLEEVEKECHAVQVPFHLLSGDPVDEVASLVESLNLAGLITDFTPLKTPLKWLQNLEKRLPSDVSIYQVDTHNVVPCWEAANSVAGRAFLMRQKIEAKINDFFTEFPKFTVHPHNSNMQLVKNDFTSVLEKLTVDRSVAPVEWARGGMWAGRQRLDTFLADRLPQYGTYRNNPEHDCVSNLSPWLHFGHISAQRCILEVKLKERDHKDGVEEFFKEAVVWREMSDNFCFYNEDYDTPEGAAPAMLASLRQHASDPRPYTYTLEELENARTHDDLWNTAQIQMVTEGKMHTFFRTYWGKKILEWVDAENAYKFAVYLNDKYNLDGNDPNGYAGCAWCVLGVHDRDFPDRPITGKIRTMSYRAQFNKFDVKKLVRKYGAKAYNK